MDVDFDTVRPDRPGGLALGLETSLVLLTIVLLRRALLLLSEDDEAATLAVLDATLTL